MATSRIPVLAQPDADVAAVLAKTLPTKSGRPLNLFATLAHHSELLRRWNALGGLFIAHGRLEPRVRELVILRVAALTQCAYEWRQHVVLGHRAGLTEQEVAWLRDGGDHGEWSDADLAYLAATEQLVLTHDVDDATWARLAPLLGVEELLELQCLVGFYAGLAGLCNATRILPDEDTAS